jgi:hypothetical protein
MANYIYDNSGKAVGFWRDRYIYALSGKPIGQLRGTNVHTLRGSYVSEPLQGYGLVDTHRGNFGSIGSSGNPGNPGSPGNPGNRILARWQSIKIANVVGQVAPVR